MSDDKLDLLLADGVIDEVLGRLKSGKEANISLVRRGELVLAAKVYKDRSTRSFKNNADYKEGRKVRNSRTQRAMDSGGKFGRDAAEQEWKSAEADALYKLSGSGVRVPEPVMFYEGVLLMDVVRDAEGQTAPRLIDVPIEADAALGIYADLVAQMISMLCCDLIHGDLSPYNILAAADGPTIIDFPQVVSAVHSSRAEYFFLRDFDNVVRFLAGFDPSLGVHTADGRAIWRAYVSRELTPQFVPPPPPPPRPTRGPDRRSRPDERGRGGRPQQNSGGRPQQNTGGRPQQNTGGRPQQNTGGRPQYSADRPPQNSGRPQQNNDRPQYSADRPQYSADRPPQNNDRPQYSADRSPQNNGGRPQQNPQQANGERPQTNRDGARRDRPPQRFDARGQQNSGRPQQNSGDRPQQTTGDRPQTNRDEARNDRPQRSDGRDQKSSDRPQQGNAGIDHGAPPPTSSGDARDNRAPQRFEGRIRRNSGDRPRDDQPPQRSAQPPSQSNGERPRDDHPPQRPDRYAIEIRDDEFDNRPKSEAARPAQGSGDRPQQNDGERARDDRPPQRFDGRISRNNVDRAQPPSADRPRQSDGNRPPLNNVGRPRNDGPPRSDGRAPQNNGNRAPQNSGNRPPQKSNDRPPQRTTSNDRPPPRFDARPAPKKGGPVPGGAGWHMPAKPASGGRRRPKRRS